jgi:hypothetical protein
VSRVLTVTFSRAKSLRCGVVAGFLVALGATAAAVPAGPAPTAIQSFTLKGYEDFPRPRGPYQLT